MEDSQENHDNRINKESTSDFLVVDDYRNKDPIISQVHKNELREEENALPLLNNNVGPYEALPSDWKGLFFMFQDDSIKEQPSKILGNSDGSDIEKTEEDASLGHATDEWFFFMFEHSSPALEI